jgi:hypothetical protein
MNKYTIPLDQLGMNDVPSVGGKMLHWVKCYRI